MSKQNKNKYGYLKSRTDGRLELRVKYVDASGFEKTKYIYGHTEEECNEKAKAFLKLNEKRIDKIDVDSTVVKIIQAFCDDKLASGNIGEQGYSRNMSSLKIIKNDFIGNVALRLVTEEDVKRFSYRLAEDYSDSSIKKVWRLLKNGYKEALKSEIVEKNLLEDISRPKSKKNKRKVNGLSEENQNKLVKFLEEDFVPRKNRNNYTPQMLISLFTGLRMGEVNALKISDIDFLHNRIYINATISRGKDYRVFYKPTPKTEAGERDIPLFDVVRDILVKAVENAEKANNPMGLLFYDSKEEKYITTQQVSNSYERICKKVGIPYQGVHALRHTFASRKIEARVSAKTIQQWMGHKSITTTYDIYGDVFARQEERDTDLGNNKYEGHYLKEDFGSKKGSKAKVRPIKKRRKR